MAVGSNRFLQYVKQSSPTTMPTTPAFTRLRSTGGSGIANNRTAINSNEIRSDRQIIVNRLGQNQPDITVPFELSFDSYDDFIQAALGGTWVGGFEETVTASLDTGGVLTLDSGTWADYPNFHEGDYIYFTASTNTDVLGYIHDITSDDMTIYDIEDSVALTTTTEAEASFTIKTGHYAASFASSELAVNATTRTLTRSDSDGSWITLGVEAGDKIFMDAGFPTATNYGSWFEVDSVDSATVLTLLDPDENLVTESSNAATQLITSTGFCTVGTGLDYFAIEEGFTDVDSGTDIDGESVTDGVFHYVLGAYPATWNMNIQPDAVLSGEFAFQALTYSGFKNETAADSYVTSNTNDVFDSFTGELRIPDASSATGVITGLNFSIDNGLVRRYALMNKDAISIGEGRSNVTGTLNAYFEDATVSNMFENETDFDMAIRTEDLDGNSYTFGWPKIKLTSDSRDVSENDVTETFNFQALGGASTDTKKTMYILRQPKIS
jgi:hypothetical protein